MNYPAAETAVRNILLTANYITKRYKETIWIIGEGRSGTTWLSEIVNYDKKYREMFEPFHPIVMKEIKNIGYFKYIRPEYHDESFYRLSSEVFTGKFLHPRVDSQCNRILYKGLLIKDIFANLFAKWVDVNFPEVKKILLMRHPFSVALSKMKLMHWKWMTEPKEFLKQKELLDDYLRPFETLIEKTNGYFEKQILIWSIVNYIPLKQFKDQEVHLVFYEELCSEPIRELQRLFSYLYGLKNGVINSNLLKIIKLPSRKSRQDSPIVKDKYLLDSWKRELQESQIKKGLKILQSFGLDSIYNTNLMPSREAAECFLET